MTIAFDSLAFKKRLEASGVPAAHAEAHAEAARDYILADLVSGEDIKPLLGRTEFQDALKKLATKDDLKAFATKDDLKAFATKDDLKVYATKADLAELKADLVWKIIWINGALLAIFTALDGLIA
ncbi:MAG: hypothetical protein ACFB22_07660 [Rhodothalassiaceae bacterium]